MFHGASFFGGNRAFAVQRLAKRVQYATQLSFAYGNVYDATGTFDHVAFVDALVFTKNDATDGIFFQVERHAHNTVAELKQLITHSIGKTMNVLWI